MLRSLIPLLDVFSISQSCFLVPCNLVYVWYVSQNTNDDVRATQDISKSATEVIWDFAKWLSFQFNWSEDRKWSSDFEEKFQVTWVSR